MTRELTEADLRVEKDRLLEGGRTPEQVARGQRHMNSIEGDVLIAALAHLLDSRSATLEGLASDERISLFVPASMARAALRLGEAILDEHEQLSPPETPAGVHAPRPQTPLTGTPCQTCRRYPRWVLVGENWATCMDCKGTGIAPAPITPHGPESSE